MRLGTVTLVCALAAAAGGCSDDEPPEAPEDATYTAKSGSRLKARYFVDDEGARVFAGWFDSLRGEACRVARGEGGRYYCFPYGNPALYADARCRQPLGVHGGCAARYTAIARGDSRCDNETLALWEEGGPVELPTQYRWGGDSCLASERSPTASLVAATQRLPDSELVSGESTPPRADLRLASRLVRFADGAVAPSALIDSRWKRCKPVATTAGIRCVPEAAVYAGVGPYFGDRGCGAMVAHAEGPACLTPLVGLLVSTSNGCPGVSAAFALGPRLDPREVFSGSECQRGRLLPGHFYMMGAPLELTAFPALQVNERGRGRMRVRTYAAGDGVPVPYLGVQLFDSRLNVECRVVPASDGVLRCLPLEGPATLGDAGSARFADPDCTVPLARVGVGGGCASAMAAAPATMVARVSEQLCPESGAEGALEPARWDIHRLGAPHTGVTYQRGSAGCVEATPVTGEAFHALDDVIAPSEFAAFRQE
jgi:hypothetical protein